MRREAIAAFTSLQLTNLLFACLDAGFSCIVQEWECQAKQVLLSTKVMFDLHPWSYSLSALIGQFSEQTPSAS